MVRQSIGKKSAAPAAAQSSAPTAPGVKELLSKLVKEAESQNSRGTSRNNIDKLRGYVMSAAVAGDPRYLGRLSTMAPSKALRSVSDSARTRTGFVIDGLVESRAPWRHGERASGGGDVSGKRATGSTMPPASPTTPWTELTLRDNEWSVPPLPRAEPYNPGQLRD